MDAGGGQFRGRVRVAIGAELREAIDAIEAWIADDPDRRDQAELRGLLDLAETGDGGVNPADAADAEAELRDRFTGRLTFGTAGLRGAVGAGPNRMNRAVVRAATAAVAGWLLDAASATTPAVVVGCDARHRSADFADEAARVLAGAGIRVHLLPRPGPTPLLAFAVLHLGADAGIMITASHNPAADNGYKLYLSDGAQVIPPVDAEIEGRIADLGPLSAVRTANLNDPLIARHGDEVAAAYLDAIVGQAAAGAAADTDLTVVYTPMHGVAGELMVRAIQRAGFAAPHVVAAQGKPDPDFPTVSFPNPEEPGALDLALADARAQGADLVLASDPDGDRLAVAVPTADGGWRQLKGDQVGALLGAFLLDSQTPAAQDRVVATTIVSSTLLSKIAAKAGARCEETLTGFKWIARAADGQPGATFVFGYEEALGYEVGQAVRDKDGIGAALAVLAMTAAAKADTRSLTDELDDLERAHGVHLTEQLSLRIPDPAGVMRRLRAAPPTALGGWPVEKTTDYTSQGTGLPPSDVLSYTLPQARAVVRPSGTEPKIKAYLEVAEPAMVDLAAARGRAAQRMEPLRAAVTALLAQ
ncbi:MAG TPA: phospho-sugar mutase [Trebonia sp.]|nr:phospho-sugar mutase [Trebonia sp.]